MKNFRNPAWVRLVVFSCLLCCANARLPAAERFGPDLLPGLWQQVDDASGRTQALVRIDRVEAGLYRGIVEKYIPAEGEDPNPKCEQCRDRRRNQPVIGMQIIEGLKRVGENVYEQGTILDPDEGTVYRLKIEVMEKGTKLEVRGYVGISLFGRSQTWPRNPQVR